MGFVFQNLKLVDLYKTYLLSHLINLLDYVYFDRNEILVKIYITSGSLLR